jgi:ADP-heptose:LPS heptosyltransferase
MSDPVLVHLAAGLGNIVLATPLVLALAEMDCSVDIRLDADYPATIDLFANWSAVRSIRNGAAPLPLTAYRHLVPSVPPFYWPRFAHLYRNRRNTVIRPPDALFAENEQAYYLEFARCLGFPQSRQMFPSLPVAPSPHFGVTASTIVLAPGCKTGIMAAKRWPHFGELALRLPDVALAGTQDDVSGIEFPPHARSFIGRLTLAETAAMIASVGLAVANDSGLAHLAAACGTPTLMLFGPTSDCVLGPFPPHVSVLRAGLPCEPCWTSAPLRQCSGSIACLQSLSVDRVLAQIEAYPFVLLQ